MFDLSCWVPDEITRRFEVYNYNHALEILDQSFPIEWKEIKDTLQNLNISINDLLMDGGNESPIPPKFSRMLEPLGWKEIRISGDLTIKLFPRRGDKKGVFASNPIGEKIIKEYIDGHNIDYVKSRIAIDIEWNSKDQTFDRDLFAMRTYYECDIISVGVIITRSEELNKIFQSLSIMKKYGASTTWMGKLLPRLASRRHGGCPILAFGIKNECVTDWSEQ